MEALLCSLEDPEVQIIKSITGETPLLLTALHLIVDLEFLGSRKLTSPTAASGVSAKNRRSEFIQSGDLSGTHLPK
jgi:hypothetical protein